MADTLLAGEFWLPPEFFSDDESLPDKQCTTFNRNPNFTPNLSSPINFPSNFGSEGSGFSSSAFGSPAESVRGSTETESDSEDDPVAELTRSFTQLGLQTNLIQRNWPFSTSPQSTLAGAGIWARRRPPPVAAGDGGSWDLLNAAVAGQVARMKMNGGDEVVLNVREQVGPTCVKPLGNNPGGYGHRFPLNLFEQGKQNQNPNQNNCCSILGRLSVDDLLHRQILLQQHIVSLHRSNVLGQIQFQENAKHLCPTTVLSQYAGRSPLVQHRIDQMRGASLARFGPKPKSAGTGVFIPRPIPSNFPNKPVAGCSAARRPPVVYQVVNKNVGPTSTSPAIRDHDISTVRSKMIPIQRPDDLGKHAQCRLPLEWSY